MNRVAELPPARVVARTWHFAHPLVRRYRVFAERPAGQALVIAELDATQVHHAIHHRDFDILSLAGAIALVDGGQQPDRQMQSGTRITDLRAGHERCAIGNTGGAHRTAHGLRDVLVRLEFRVRSR